MARRPSARLDCGATAAWALLAEERAYLRRGLLRVLQEGSMRRVRVDPKRGVRDQPGHEVAEPGRDHQVVVALDDQGRRLDPGEPLQRAVVRDAPVEHGVIL